MLALSRGGATSTSRALWSDATDGSTRAETAAHSPAHPHVVDPPRRRLGVEGVPLALARRAVQASSSRAARQRYAGEPGVVLRSPRSTVGRSSRVATIASACRVRSVSLSHCRWVPSTRRAVPSDDHGGLEQAALLAAGEARQQGVGRRLERQPAEQGGAVLRPRRTRVGRLVVEVRGIREVHAEPLGEHAGLVLEPALLATEAVDLLERHEVGAAGLDDVGDPAEVEHAVEADAAVDVVGEQAQGISRPGLSRCWRRSSGGR